MTSNELDQLARQVEAHLSPAYRAQLLEADLAIGNALREVVSELRAKRFPPLDSPAVSTGFLKFNAGKKNSKTLPDLVGLARLGQSLYSVSAWKNDDESAPLLRLRFTLQPVPQDERPDSKPK
jgi:hypothetical protein